MEKHELVVVLLHEHLHVGHPGQLVERRELEIVRGEERAAADLRLQVLDHRLGDREAVIGARAAADLVEDHEAAGGGPIEDSRGLRHLHEKCACAAGDVVARADPGEEPVDDADPGPLRRHEASGLREHCKERRLPDERALATHVGPGHEEDGRRAVAAGREREVVGYERAGRKQALENRMTPFVDQKLTARRDLGPHPAARSGHVGEGGEHVELCEDLRRAVEPHAVFGYECSELLEQLDLAARGLVFGAEHLALPHVEIGRGVALGVFHRLLADVVGRHFCGMRTAHFEEKPEHSVEAHLERRNAGALDLASLILGDPGLAARGEFDEPVVAVVEPGADEAAVAGEHRAALPQRGVDPGGEVGAGVEPGGDIAEQARRAGERGDEFGQDDERAADPLEIAGAGPARDHAAGEPLEVADAGELLDEPRRPRGVAHERGNGVEPLVDSR